MIPRPGRLAPGEMFPSGLPGFGVRWLAVGAERVRAIICEPPPGTASGQVALFVHGWACSTYTWRHVLRPVADAGVRAVAVDLRGHGLSSKPLDPAAYTLPALARHLADVLDALAIARALVVGHSMGGAIAMRLAMDAPERVAGLVLPAPVGFGAIDYMRLVPWLTPEPVGALLPYVAFRWTVKVGLWRAYGGIGRPSERDVDEYWAPSRDPAFPRAMRLLAHAFDWTRGRPEDLARVGAPVSILFGERDHLVRPADAEPLARRLPDARIETVPRAGHALPDEVPAVVTTAVIDAATAWSSRFS